MRLCTIVLFLLVASVASGQVSVISTTPAHNSTSVPLEATISVTFSGEVDTTLSFAPGENYFTNVTTLLGQWWSTDRRTISFSVVLEPSTVYFLLIHSAKPAAGGGFPVPYCFYWTTGAAFPTDLHSVSGTIFSGGSPVTPDNAIVGLGATPFSGSDPAFVGAAVTDALGQFTIPYVANGTWYPIAAKDADLNGVIDPSEGDPLAFGDSVIVSGADVTGFNMQFFTYEPVRFAAARDAISAKASELLPPNHELRQFYGWQVDSTGAAKEFDAMYTVPGSEVLTEIWMEAFGTQYDTMSIWNYGANYSRPYTGLASAALLDSVVARAERMGGKEFRRQAPPVAGSYFNAYARLGALHNSEFSWMVSDTSQDYWGLQYTFQVQVTRDSSYSVAWKMFLASATTGEIINVTGVEEEGPAALPTSYALAQNFPNPFNPATTIRYALPEAAAVKLVVFNSLGQRVADLVDEAQAAGHHEVRFDGSTLSSGVYFYRLQVRPLDSAMGRDSKSGAGDLVLTKSLLLLK